jgi:hypothetical protein
MQTNFKRFVIAAAKYREQGFDNVFGEHRKIPSAIFFSAVSNKSQHRRFNFQ